MAFPQTPLAVKVELALGADLTADPGTWVWTDITGQALHRDLIRIARGRANEQSQLGPSKALLTLKNTNGQFVPWNPNSPYFGQLRRNTPSRIQVDPGSGFVPRFTGFVSEWPPRWDISGNDKYVQIQADGITRRLERGATPLKSALYRASVHTNPLPTAYWPLEDGKDAAQAGSGLINGSPMLITGSPVFGSDQKPAGSAGSVSFTSADALSGPVSAPATSNWTVSFWVRGEPGSTGTLPVRWFTRNDQLQWYVVADMLGALQLFGSDTTGATYPLLGPYNTNLTDGRWRHVIVVAFQNGLDISLSMRVDGAVVDSTNFVGQTVSAITSVRVGAGLGTGTSGQVCHLGVWNTPTTQNLVYDPIFRAGGGYAGETASSRIARLAREEGMTIAIPAAEDFEDAVLNYTVTGTWARTSSQARTGSWSFKSAAIGNSASTDAIVTVPAGARTMQFWYKVSSERNFDFFQLLLDGNQKLQASGEVDWTQATVDVTGVSQVTFRYIKDSSAVGGLDAAFIDDLDFFPSEPMGPQTVDTFLNLLRECEAADGGILYETTNGRLDYLTRAARYNRPVGLALDYAQGHVAKPFEPVDDDQNVSNDWTVERKGGSKAQVVDAAHIAENGLYDSSVALSLASDNVLASHAGWRVRLGTNGELRYPRLGLDLAARPSLIASWLASDVGTRATVSNPPVDLPPDLIDLFIEGYTETLGFYEWTVDANCSPARPWNVAKLNDAVLGRLDSAGSKTDASITSIQTTLSSQLTTGAWVTSASHPGEFPFDIMVGGERMTVTAISLFAGAYTFTVIRSVNGVVKSHPVQTAIHVADPAVLAL